MDHRNTNGHRKALIGAVVGAVLAWPLVALGSPLGGDPIVLSQPDGKTFIAVPGGDEWFNWVSHDGRLVMQDSAGWWRYAAMGKGAVAPTGARVGRDTAPRNAATLDDIPTLAMAVGRGPVNSAAEPATLMTRATNRPVLVVLVEFQDRALTTSDAQWSSAFFGTSGKTVRTYYEEASGGNLRLVPAAESCGTSNDGVVRVLLPTSAHNGGLHPNPYSVTDNRNRWVVYDGLSAADTYVNFAGFDGSAPSGYITADELHVVVVVAGYEYGYDGASTPTPAVCAHWWSLGFAYGGVVVPSVAADGVTLCDWNGSGSGYCQVGEIHTDHPATIGIPCHELGHDMGLPDLYDTTYASHGVGAHCLMGHGGSGMTASDAYRGQTPVGLCAWSRLQLGFVVANVAWGNRDYTLRALGSGGGDVIWVSTRDPNQYFLVENRQLVGFDEGLYRWFSVSPGGAGGGGLAVWHVDQGVANNDNWSHKLVDLEEANTASVGYGELDSYSSGWQGNRLHYYFAGHMVSFNDSTVPSARLYDAGPTYLSLLSVSASGPTMKCYLATLPSSTRVLEWSTFLGGAGNDTARGVAVDGAGNVYVAGATGSSGFPTTPGAYDRNYGSSLAAFVAKFSSGGSLLYSTFLETNSSTGRTSCYGLAVDAGGCAHLTGGTTSGFPLTAGAYDPLFSGSAEAYVAKLSAAGNSLVYGTYLGGDEGVGYTEAGWGIAVDGTGSACVSGITAGSGFPHTLGGYGGSQDAFLVRLNTAGTGVYYSRLLGGMGGEWSGGVDADASGNACFAGYTTSSNFPTTTGAYDTTPNGGRDGFLVKLGPSGSLDYSTYIGGGGSDYGYDVAIDPNGYAYVAGTTGSPNFPTTPGVIGPAQIAGSGDVFVTKLLPVAYAGLSYSTYLGGSAGDEAWAIDVDAAGRAHLAGLTGSTDFPLAYPFFGYAGQADAFGAAISAGATAIDFSTYLGGTQPEYCYDTKVDAFGAIYIVGETYSSNFPVTAGAYDTTYNGGTNDAFLTKIGWAPVTTSLVVVSPDGGEVWRQGRTFAIQWCSAGVGSQVRIELSRSGYGGPWETLYAATSNDGSESWLASGTASAACVIRITDPITPSLTDVGNAVFSIAVPGDLDGDGDVDIDDFDLFAGCLSGPGNPPGSSPLDSANADLDDDGDVDLVDAVLFQAIFTG